MITTPNTKQAPRPHQIDMLGLLAQPSQKREMGSNGAVKIAGHSLNSGFMEDPWTFSVFLRAQLYNPGAQSVKAVEPAAMAAKHIP
ncbi:hypothetical protein VE02_10345, partial [Pseudogymnoascus sp. 03VT05]